jgi:hypothetical protein
MKIELLPLPDCPHDDASRAPLGAGLTELQFEEVVEDEDCAYPSPTILVNCVDVIGSPTVMKAAGGVDVQTEQSLLGALRKM